MIGMQTTSPTTRAFGICFLAMAALLSFLPLLPVRAALPAGPDLSLYGGSYQDSILASGSQMSTAYAGAHGSK